MLYLDDGIPVNSQVNSATFANEETWFELNGAELLVEHSHTAGGFTEAARTEMCKGNLMLNNSQMSSWIVQARIR